MLSASATTSSLLCASPIAKALRPEPAGGLRTSRKASASDVQAPLVSIVTVVLNGAGTLERALQSVLQQSFRDYEYLIIDGGSTDGTLDIVRKYEARIRYWCSEPDDGLYDAMSKGARAARGQWILF